MPEFISGLYTFSEETNLFPKNNKPTNVLEADMDSGDDCITATCNAQDIFLTKKNYLIQNINGAEVD